NERSARHRQRCRKRRAALPVAPGKSLSGSSVVSVVSRRFLPWQGREIPACSSYGALRQSSVGPLVGSISVGAGYAVPGSGTHIGAQQSPNGGRSTIDLWFSSTPAATGQ